MAAARALGRAFLAAGGTMVFLGGATVILSSGAMAVARVVMDNRRAEVSVPCKVCRTKRRVVCEVCQGERLLKYWPTRDPPPVQTHTWAVCVMCEGQGDHPCVNCTGTGTVNRMPWEAGEELLPHAAGGASGGSGTSVVVPRTGAAASGTSTAAPTA